MDWEETHWNWHAGLVRRAALGLVLYAASVALVCVLTASAWNERDRLNELGQMARLHRTMVQAYTSLDGMAAQLSNSPSLRMARASIEPMANALERADLEAASAADVGSTACVRRWVDALRTLQFATWSAPGPCDPRGAGSWGCREGPDRLELTDLADFEKGLHAVVQLQTYLTSEVRCEVRRTVAGDSLGAPSHHAQVCRLYGQIGETSWRQLHDFATLYESPKPSNILPRNDATEDRCFPDRSPLQGHDAFAARVKGSGAALTVNDFIRLSDKLSEEDRMIAGRQQGVTAGPSGLVSMSMGRNTTVFLATLAGFLMLAYASLNLRKLCELNRQLGLHSIDGYRTFTRLSQMFTLPVFREGPRGSVVDIIIRMLAWSPMAAWFCMLAAWGVTFVLSRSQSPAFVWSMLALVGLQALMLADIEFTRVRVIEGYRAGADHPQPSARTPEEKEPS